MPKNRENLAHKNDENFEVSKNTEDANKKVEHSVQADVIGKQKTQDEIDAERLFSELSADLRKRKKEYKEYLVAVKKGEREEDDKMVEPKGFDKNSAKYEAWQQKADMVWFESSDEQKQDRILDLSRQKLEEVRSKLAQLEKESGEKSLSDEYTKNIGKEAMLSASIRAMEKIRKEKESLETRREVLDNTGDQLGDNNPALVEGRAELTAAGTVADTQSEAIAGLLVSELKSDVSNDDSPIPVPVDYYSDSIILDPSALEEINEDFNNAETQQIRPETLKKLETVGSDRGVKKIKDYFDSYIERDAAQGAMARDQVLTKKLKEVVGDDEFFADLLLKDENFKKAVKNFFDVKITFGPFIGKMLERAAQLNWILDVASNTYKNLKNGVEELNPEEITEVGDEQEQDSVGQSVVERVLPEKEETQATLAYFKELIKNGPLGNSFENPKQVEMQVKKLQADMGILIKDWQMNSDELQRTPFYKLVKKNELKNSIAEINFQIKANAEALVDMGESITDLDLQNKLLPDSDVARLNKVVGDHLKELKQELAKNDTRTIFDKYSDLAVVTFAFLTIALNVAQAGREKDLSKHDKTAIVTMAEKVTTGDRLQSVMPDYEIGGESTMNVDKGGMTPAKDMSVPPKEVIWGGSSEGPAVESGFTNAGDLIKTNENNKPESKNNVNEAGKKRHKKNKAESKKPTVDEFVDYGAKVADYERRISSQFNYIQTLKEYGAKNDKPVLDIASMSDKEIEDLKKDSSSAMWTGNAIAENEKKLEALRNEFKDYSTRYHQSVIDKEDKIVTSKPEKLDLSYLAERGNMNDLADDEDLSFKASPFYGRELASAHNILRTVLEFSRDTKDAAKLKNYVSDVNKALRVYKQSFDEAHHPINAYTKNQYELGKKFSENILAELQKAITENRAPNLIPVRNGGKAFDRNALMRAEIEKEAK